MKLAIVGASFAGLSCALEAQKLYPEMTISIFEKEVASSYRPTALNQRLKGDIADFEEAKTSLLAEVEKSGIAIHYGCQVLAIDSKQKRLEIQLGHQTEQVFYDDLVLAMGAGYHTSMCRQAARSRVLSLKSLASQKESFTVLQKARSVLILGAGHVGLGLAEALSHYPVAIQMIEAQSAPLAKSFDPEMTRGLVIRLQEKGVQLAFNQTVDEITFDEETNQVCARTLKGVYKADYVVLATNVKPHSQLVKGQLDLDLDGTIMVDAYCRTSQPHIFAVGDLIKVPVTWFEKAYLPMLNTAMLTGRLAAYNLLENRLPMNAVDKVSSISLYGQVFTSLGLTEKEASLWTDVFRLPFREEKLKIEGCLLVEEKTGRFLGLQLISEEEKTALLAAFSLMLAQEMTDQRLLSQVFLYQEAGLSRFCYDLAEKSFCYRKQKGDEHAT